MHARSYLYAFCLFAAGAAAVGDGAPAFADVKAGVDAWATGDFAAAVREWREPAERGDPDAQFNLAQAYRLGRGVEANQQQAEILYAKAAAQGHLKAADNYGLLLFQDGRRGAAMPYLTAASQRGDPRAQYLIGLAHFNGDLMPKDWARAYALLTLSNAAGLPQAAPAIRQMDEFIPRAEREQAQVLAQALGREADAKRTVQLAAADLGVDPAGQDRVESLPIAASGLAAISDAVRVTGSASPADAGADYTQANRVPIAAPAPASTAGSPQEPKTAPARTAHASAGNSGPWKLQLGAFSVDGNAEKLWRQLSSRSELAGKTRLLVPTGRLTRLLAGGYPTRAAAQQACASLQRSGQTCLVVR